MEDVFGIIEETKWSMDNIYFTIGMVIVIFLLFVFFMIKLYNRK
jgi:hypothetical protein